MTRFPRIATVIIAVSMLSAAAGEVRADAQVEEKTEFKMTGVVGAMVNVFGGKAAREGVTNETTVKGNRRNRVTANSGELVDLNEEKIYRIDYARKTYTVQTFDEVRKQFEEGMKRSKERPSEDSPKDKKEGPEYEVDFDVKETSEKQVINGWNTKRMIMTVTVREKGKKLADSGGAVITSDMWMGPQLVSYKEIADFDRRYYAKLYGGLLSTGDMQQTVALMAATPAFAKGMKAFNEKKVTLTGTPIRTEVTFETVTGKNQPRKSEEEQASEDEQTAASRMIGGLMGKMRKRQSSEEKSDDGAAQKKSSDPNRSVLFSSKSEVLKADGNASADDVAIPAGFKKK